MTADRIFLVDPETKEPKGILPVSFSDINIKERADLEEWVVKHPELLGEDLLIITNEFSKFDGSNRRLDILALDTEGVVVVIELKLDATKSFADLQAIRYAAFCSTMTMDDVLALLAKFENSGKENASEKVREFLDVEELPELGNRPRIILAAGSMDDQELTSSVLWLRNFGVDISCVELAPYRIPDLYQIILVPRIIIPIPEAKEYQIRVQEKEVSQIKKDRTPYLRLWQAIAEEFNKLEGSFKVEQVRPLTSLRMPMHDSGYEMRYEWWLWRDHGFLGACINFSSNDIQENLRLIEIIRSHESQIREGIDLEFRSRSRKTAYAEFRIPYEGDFPSTNIAPEAARVMKLLIDRTWPLIEPCINK